MKYLIPFTLFLLVGCNHKPEPHTFLCMSALTPLGGIEFDTSSPQVVESRDSLKLTTEQGNVVIVPKSLCVQVIRADGGGQ